MIGLLTAAPTHAPGVISFTIEQLWQMILSIAGGITAISAAIVVIIKAIKKAKEPDTKQNMKLIEHDKHLEDIDRKGIVFSARASTSTNFNTGFSWQ